MSLSNAISSSQPTVHHLTDESMKGVFTTEDSESEAEWEDGYVGSSSRNKNNNNNNNDDDDGWETYVPSTETLDLSIIKDRCMI